MIHKNILIDFNIQEDVQMLTIQQVYDIYGLVSDVVCDLPHVGFEEYEEHYEEFDPRMHFRIICRRLSDDEMVEFNFKVSDRIYNILETDNMQKFWRSNFKVEFIPEGSIFDTDASIQVSIDDIIFDEYYLASKYIVGMLSNV